MLFFLDRSDGAGDMRHRDSEAQRKANLFFVTATTTARETEDGLKDGLAKFKPFAVL